MATLTVEGKQYDIEALSDEAKALTSSISMVDGKIAQLQAEVAIMQTARNAYVQQLMSSLNSSVEPVKKVATRKRTASTKPAPKKSTTTRSRKKTEASES